MDARLAKIIEEANDYGYFYDNALVVTKDDPGSSAVTVKMVDTDDPDPESRVGSSAEIILVSYGEDMPLTELLHVKLGDEMIMVTPTGRNLFRLMYG